MEKRISYSQFQQVKSAAKMIDPNMRKMEALKKKIEPLVAELKGLKTQNDSLEAGIVAVLGFHVSDLVKKVIEPTGKTDVNGKPIMVTKYLPTDIVTYDEQKKQYVITVPDEEETEVTEPTLSGKTFSELNTESANETQAEAGNVPWNN